MNAKMFLIEITRVDVDSLNLEETVVATAILDLAAGKFAQLGLEVPDAISDRLVRLNRELDLKVRDQRLRELRLLEQENVGLMTKEEKRAKNETRQAKLREQLGITQPSPAASAPPAGTQ